VGRGVIIHAKPDDGGQPVGNAGARIGFGVIGVGNPKQ
jgi:superoxide dismutase, Cu-Zn family